MGTNDLAKETRARMVPGRAPMVPWMMGCIAAARAYRIDILDGPFNDIGDGAGFAQECAQARDLGFDGKTLIHPSQVEACNAAFSPSAEEVAQAQQNHRGVRAAGESRQGRHCARRPHGGAPACRHSAPHGGDRGGDRRAADAAVAVTGRKPATSRGDQRPEWAINTHNLEGCRAA